MVGYHGCQRDFARGLAAGWLSAEEWRLSQNEYDWFGEGIYFWEHAPGRAWQWARERYGDAGAVVAAEVRLGRCLDLADTAFTALLRPAYTATVELYTAQGWALPRNEGRDFKLQKLDRLIVGQLVKAATLIGGKPFQTVRCPFEEGEAAYEGAMIHMQSHVQIAVRDRNCIGPRVYTVKP